MLHFHGIRFKNGIPERFSKRYELLTILRQLIEQLASNEYHFERVRDSIRDELERLYTEKANNQQKRRFISAQLSRKRDLLYFLFKDKKLIPQKIQLAKILLERKTIEGKWKLMVELFHQKIFPAYSDELLEVILSSPDHPIYRLLQTIHLFFLEQTEERPPANIQLKFIPLKFPTVLWIHTEGTVQNADAFWTPQDTCCRFQYLSSSLLVRPQLLGESSKSIETKPPIASSKQKKLPSNFYHQGALPAQISLEYQAKGRNPKQLELIPESPAETLITFQKDIQKSFSHEGLKHFLAIMKQLTQQDNVLGQFSFVAHFQRLYKHLPINPSSKALDLTHLILDSLQNLKVIRRWQEGNDWLERKQPFLTYLGEETTSSNSHEVSNLPKYLYQIDPLFISTKHHPYGFGTSLSLIEDAIFQESTRQHALLTGLAAYLNGSWLLEFPQQEGVLEKNAEEIFAGCSFNISASGKYRMIHKLRDELSYMEKKNYISNFKVISSREKNPWKDIYRIRAPRTSLQRIKSIHQHALAPQQALSHYA